MSEKVTPEQGPPIDRDELASLGHVFNDIARAYSSAPDDVSQHPEMHFQVDNLVGPQAAGLAEMADKKGGSDTVDIALAMGVGAMQNMASIDDFMNRIAARKRVSVPALSMLSAIIHDRARIRMMGREYGMDIPRDESEKAGSAVTAALNMPEATTDKRVLLAFAAGASLASGNMYTHQGFQVMDVLARDIIGQFPDNS